MYLRETKRRNKDGSTVSYLQLAHNERHPVTGSPVAKVIHSFGRADQVDREALARLVSSISRFLEPAEAVAAASGSDVEIVDSRRFGGAYVLRVLWERLGIAEALIRAGEKRRLEADLAEQVLFALVANRCLEPTSKLAAVRWARERVALVGCPSFDDDAAYAAMDFLLDALGEVARGIFDATANLLNLSCDVIFVDTSSTYFETDVPDPLVELDTATGEAEARGQVAAGIGPEERATRRFNKHSKDHRPDLPQVVLGMAVTAEGIPIRCWTFPGTTSDQAILKTIKDDLSGWMLHRVVWVADCGFNSADNRAYLQHGGGHYIVAERVRGGSKDAKAALARAGRYHKAAGNLEVKEVRLGDGARTERFVVCHNPEVAARDRKVRENLVSYLEQRIAGTDEWTARRRDELVGELRQTPALYRLVRRTAEGKLRVDKGAIANEERFDGKFLLRTDDDTLTPTDLALAYKQLYEVEAGWRDLKGTLKLRPVFHYREDRIRAHVQLCWLALLLIRTVEHTIGDTWRNVRNELERMHLVTLETNDGRVAQRSATTARQREIFQALEVAEPARFYDFTLPEPVA
ncbi:MAG TPA: IS1634 family transposase [Acidimicrobiales bacterium]|nr:IS1634 family transposase [Acidimicrobiales bacterium]